MITSVKEMVEFMEEDCSAAAVHKAIGKLMKHGEIVRFTIGAGQQRRNFYTIPEIKDDLELLQ